MPAPTAIQCAGILRKELLPALRKPRHFFVFLIMGAALGTVLAGFWPDSAVSVTDAADFARGIFQTLVVLLGLAVLLVAPPLGVAAYAVERREGVFETLLTAPIRPLVLTASKLLSMGALSLLLVVGALPVVASLFFLAGLEIQTLALSLALIIEAALIALLLGMGSMLWIASPAKALTTAYFWTFIICVNPVVLFSVGSLDLLRLFGFFTPLAALLLQMQDASLALGLAHCASLALLAFFLAEIVARRIGRTPEKILYVPEESSSAHVVRVSPHAKPRRPIRNGMNVFVARAFGDLRLGGGSVPLATVLTFLGLLALLSIPLAQDDVETFTLLGAILTMVFLIQGVLLAALAAHRELEAETLELLRTTPLTCRDVLRGRFRAMFVWFLPFLAPLCLVGVALLFVFPQHTFALLALPAGGVSAFALAFALGMTCTAFSRKLIVVVPLAGALALALWLAGPIFLLNLDDAYNGYRAGNADVLRIAGAVLMPPPYSAFHWRSVFPAGRSFGLSAPLVLTACANWALYGALAWALLRLLERRLRRTRFAE